jgi:hypothetical protein
LPVIDAGRREIFTLGADGPLCSGPQAFVLEPGTVCVGDGALRHRTAFEAAGAEVPPRESELHLPRARFHALLARDYRSADLLEPMYVRPPDAAKAVA